MSFKDTFCSSPWFHARITNNGDYNFCRSQKVKVNNSFDNISDITPIDYFQNKMEKIRKSMVAGEVIDECSECYRKERNNIPSPRKNTLLKTGIELDNFDKTLQASPFYDEFKKTADGGKCGLPILDWQVDLGNFCNSACIFCTPDSSSRLATEFIKMNLIDELPTKAWCNDSKLVSSFIETVICTPKLKYIHFIGGETMITPAFKRILRGLETHGINDRVTIGFTTNLTVWDDEIIHLLSKFKEVNVGLSIETFDDVNDYVRYPSKINDVKVILDKWIELGKENKWLAQLRITPTWMTVDSIDTVFEYAYNNGIYVESCDFLHDPEFMRMNVLPDVLRNIAISNLEKWINKRGGTCGGAIINTRNPHKFKQALLIDAQSYVNYLKSIKHSPKLIPRLVKFLKKIEKNRENRILDYVPQYTDFLKSNGY